MDFAQVHLMNVLKFSSFFHINILYNQILRKILLKKVEKLLLITTLYLLYGRIYLDMVFCVKHLLKYPQVICILRTQ